jgi:[ribosomal protein S5]-alanine N-acetyltransferase
MEIYRYEDHLQSERLISNKLTLEDIPAWSEFFRSDETTEFLKVHVLETPELSAEQWILRQLNRYANNEYGLQALFNKETNEFVGLCGLLLQEVEGQKYLEVGYHMLRKHWGKGYAPEAARMFLDYAFNELGREDVISIIHVDNIKSQRVADKNGLTRLFKTHFKDLDVWIYKINKDQYMSRLMNQNQL